jgi:hypothetical protein
MASSQQEQQACEIAPASRGNSNRIAALNLDGQSPPCIDDYDQQVSIILSFSGFFSTHFHIFW